MVLRLLTLLGILWFDPAWALTIEAGLARFSSDHPQNESYIRLTGSWRFYPSQFLTAETLDLSRSFPSITTDVPGTYVGQTLADGTILNEGTWGSYVLELDNLPKLGTNLGLRMRADTAFRVLLVTEGHTQLILEVGRPGESPDLSIPQVADALGHLSWKAGSKATLIVHLSGFHYRAPSLWTAPVIGPYSQLERQRDWIRFSECVVIGMLFILTLYFISLHFHRREDQSSLWLAAFSGLILLRLISTSGFVTAFLFPIPTVGLYEVIRKIEYSSMGLAAACLASFVATAMQLPRAKRLLWINHAFVGAFLVFCLLTPATVFTRYLSLVLLNVVVVSMIVLALVVLAIVRRREGAVLALMGALTVVVCGWYDTSIGLGLNSSPILLLPYGMAALAFSQGQIVARLFAIAFRTAERLTHHLGEEVEHRTREIRSMLDHIPQGVLTLMPTGTIAPNYSSHLVRILETEEIAHQTLASLLLNRSRLSPDQKDRILQTAMASLGEDALNFEINAAQLPHEIIIDLAKGRQKVIQITWNPIVGRSNKVERLLITLHDITEMRAYELAAIHQRKELEYIQELVQVTEEKFSLFYGTSVQMIEENRRLIDANTNKHLEIIKILFVNMHTVKGAARTLGFHLMTGILHEVESLYATLLKNPEVRWDRDLLLKELHRAHDILQHYRQIGEEKLGRKTDRSNNVMVDRSFLEHHAQMLKKLDMEPSSQEFSHAIREASQRFEALAFEHAADVFLDILSSTHKVAKDLGKEPPRIIVKGHNHRLSFEAQKLLRQIFVHIIRNSLDHGIESARERVQKSKAPNGTISVTIEEDGGFLLIRYADDGRGLALDKLKARAQEMHFLHPDDKPDHRFIANLIFAPGLSTADSVSEVSGRGVGMDAVRRFIRDHGGSIELVLDLDRLHNQYCPFSFNIKLPPDMFINSHASIAELHPRSSEGSAA